MRVQWCCPPLSWNRPERFLPSGRRMTRVTAAGHSAEHSAKASNCASHSSSERDQGWVSIRVAGMRGKLVFLAAGNVPLAPSISCMNSTCNCYSGHSATRREKSLWSAPRQWEATPLHSRSEHLDRRVISRRKSLALCATSLPTLTSRCNVM